MIDLESRPANRPIWPPVCSLVVFFFLYSNVCHGINTTVPGNMSVDLAEHKTSTYCLLLVRKETLFASFFPLQSFVVLVFSYVFVVCVIHFNHFRFGKKKRSVSRSFRNSVNGTVFFIFSLSAFIIPNGLPLVMPFFFVARFYWIRSSLTPTAAVRSSGEKKPFSVHS